MARERNSKVYTVHKDWKLRDEARQSCQDEGGNLVVIDSQDKIEEVRGLMPDGDSHWIDDTEYMFFERDAEFYAKEDYAWWKDKEIEGPCIVMNYRLGMTALPCHNTRPYICEFDVSEERCKELAPGTEPPEIEAVETVALETVTALLSRIHHRRAIES